MDERTDPRSVTVHAGGAFLGDLVKALKRPHLSETEVVGAAEG